MTLNLLKDCLIEEIQNRIQTKTNKKKTTIQSIVGIVKIARYFFAGRQMGKAQ